MQRRFRDRRAAGRVLGERLVAFAEQPHVLVLGLPRGGVPVAWEVASALLAPMDVFVVRKLGAPGHAEFAVGAIASGGVRVLNDYAVAELGVTPDAIDQIAAREARELARREHLYRGGLAPLNVAGKTVLLVDDGLATGFTMRAAIAALRCLGPGRVVVSVPVGSPSVCAEIRALVDEFYCDATHEPFGAVSLWYDHFEQTEDDEVLTLLATPTMVQPRLGDPADIARYEAHR